MTLYCKGWTLKECGKIVFVQSGILSVFDKHAPLKTKEVRGNQGPFMTRKLSKAAMNKSKFS